MNTPTAILFGAVMIALGFIVAQFVPRYEGRAEAGASAFWRSQAEGAVEVCVAARTALEPALRRSIGCHSAFQ